jgi:hypothetical protein
MKPLNMTEKIIAVMMTITLILTIVSLMAYSEDSPRLGNFCYFMASVYAVITALTIIAHLLEEYRN